MFLRLLIEYLIFGIICFLTISLLIPKMVHTHTVKKKPPPCIVRHRISHLPTVQA